MSDPKTPPPLIDENAAPADASEDARWKSYVPSGDHRLVLSAIDNQLNAAKALWKEKHANKPHSAASERFVMDCIDQTGESLKKQLEAVTIPVDEVEAESALDSFQTRLLSTMPPSSSTSESDDDDSLSSVDDEDEDIEFDDNDIIDQDAYNQLKELRNQAREYSTRVISIREETAGRALEMTRKNLSELMRVHGFSCNSGGEDETDDNADETNDDGTTTDRRVSLKPMHIALQTLTSSLGNIDSGLAEKLESLKETIGTIDSSIDKYQRASQGDQSALSQTEKALLSSEESNEEGTTLESTDEDTTIYPDKTLARLLAGAL